MYILLRFFSSQSKSKTHFMRRIATYHRASWTCVPLAAIVFCTSADSLQASIMLPEQDSFNLEQALAQNKSTTATSSATSLATNRSVCRSASVPRCNMPYGHPLRMPESSGIELFTLLPSPTFSVTVGGSSSGATTSTSSSSGTSMFPIASAAKVNLSASELIRWVSGEQYLEIPMPPGTDLLRPPQTV